MEAMEKEEIKKLNITEKIFDVIKNYNKLSKILLIAMVGIIAIIAIILFSIESKKKADERKLLNSINEVIVAEEEDPKVVELVNEYFKAKTNLNFARLFATFGRDYYEEERNDKNNNLKNIINNIRYERIFVEKYENIKVYSAPGLRKNEKVLVVTYDMVMGFADTTAPMILMFYVVKKDGRYIINDSLDVGISKYLVVISNTDFVRAIYKDVEERLVHATESSESLKLVYNSLRQIEVNQKFNLEDINEKELIDRLLDGRVDLIRDA
ncbi:MAG: hypothetical protein IJ593_09775, partial [Lachnospiraceae bacterium]|nr:hypothetical protein [Lachnospiraceae bacterium]